MRLERSEMALSFDPRLDILPEAQRALWPELDSVPSSFVLYGGTALALQLGHRVSEDFDFFSSAGFDAEWLQAFFGGLDTLNRVHDPSLPRGSQVQVASLVDLAGMKMRVIQMRGNWKDYADIHALVTYGIDLTTALAAAKAIDNKFVPSTSVRALQFYGDGSLGRVPLTMQKDLVRWALAVDLGRLPTIPSRQGLSARKENE